MWHQGDPACGEGCLIILLKLAIDVRHPVQNQPPVCGPHEPHGTHGTPHAGCGDPVLGQLPVARAQKLAQHRGRVSALWVTPFPLPQSTCLQCVSPATRPLTWNWAVVTFLTSCLASEFCRKVHFL